MSSFIPSFLKSGSKAAAKDDDSQSDMTEIPILEAEYKEYVPRDEPVSEKETQMISDIRANKQVLLENLPEEIVNNGINTKFDAAGWIEEDWNLLKFIRASKHVMDDVMKAIRKTLEWRISYRPHAINPDEIRTDAIPGKLYMSGFDRKGRPAMIMKPYLENTRDPESQIKYVVFNMELASKIMPVGVTKLIILIDLSRLVFSMITPPKVKKMFLEVLQSHYPETLGRGIIINAPSIFFYGYKLISPFIDPVTKRKLFFASIKPNNNKQSAKLNGDSSASALSTSTPATETAAPQISAIPKLSESDIAEQEMSTKESAELVSEIKMDDKLSSDNKAGIEAPVTSDANSHHTTATDSSEERVNVSLLSDLSSFFKPSMLESSFGGDFFFRYNYDVYFPLVVKKYQQ
ncbi:CRAL-TRIO domain-containing protein [Smittium culicis]|uniref:CRAL-TRIO domain-containing protein n=1 Tax=Smittium culicis TaxID=133412 RepID=A0A1R1X6V6_9FUNG|nr:CRAL-TRIO domain-containing protein [Smittium culicis]OMJ16512.1 CRAL-TRIO domain-containing protein [Smittium culicis]